MGFGGALRETLLVDDVIYYSDGYSDEKPWSDVTDKEERKNIVRGSNDKNSNVRFNLRKEDAIEKIGKGTDIIMRLIDEIVLNRDGGGW